MAPDGDWIVKSDHPHIWGPGMLHPVAPEFGSVLDD